MGSAILIVGITQQQGDNGVPLGTCLMLCNNWIKQHTESYGVVLSVCSNHVEGKKRGAFVTWTDWDLGTCLNKECKRKNIKKPSVFNEWIDLKELYIVNTCFLLFRCKKIKPLIS